MLRQIDPEELSATLARASEIAQQPAQAKAAESELETYLRAAEEAGLPREALLQALRERSLIGAEVQGVGESVFAPSADGYLYPAEVVRLDGELTATVRFQRGGERTVARADLQPLSLVPGSPVTIEHASGGTTQWYNGTVTSYDVAGGTVTVDAPWLGKVVTVPLATARRTPRPLAKIEARLYKTALWAGTVGIGIGWLIAHFLQR